MGIAAGSGSSPCCPPVEEMGDRNGKAELLPEDPHVVDADSEAKLQADPPVDDLSSLPAEQLQTDWSSVQAFLVEKAQKSFGIEHLAAVCDEYMACQDLEMDCSKEVGDSDGCRYVGWNDLTDMALCSLYVFFKTAVKVISYGGYSEEAVVCAIMDSVLCYEFDGPISKITSSALALLQSGREVDSSPSENLDKELHMLGMYILTYALSLLKKSFPFFTFGDALWCFLVCDMDISVAHAVSINMGAYGNELSGEPVVSRNESSGPNDSVNESSGGCDGSATESLGGPAVPQSEEVQRMMSSVLIGFVISDLKSAGKNPVVEKDPVASCGQVEESSSLPRAMVQSSQVTKGSSRKRALSVSSKWDSSREVVFLENTQQILGYNKASSRALKDGKSILSMLESALSTLKSSSKVVKRKGLNASAVVSTLPLSSLAGHSSSSSFGGKPVSKQQRKPDAFIHLSLPNTSGRGFDFFFSPGEMQTNWVPKDRKEELALDLIRHLGDLKLHVKVWTEWANERVMQSTTRLAKERAILESLRKDKEEVENFEVINRKKLEEIESAIDSACDVFEHTNSATLWLADVNADLRLGKEAAKLQEAQLAAKFLDLSRKESNNLERLQSLERQKVLLQEELVAEKSKLSKLLKKLEQAKEYEDELKTRCRLEEKIINEAIIWTNFERNEREQIETSAKSEANFLILRAENDWQRFKTSIQHLELQISQWKLMDSSKFKAVTLGTDKRCVPWISELRDNSNTQLMAKNMEPPEFGSDPVQQEQECVMCLEEEISVVFLPCAHQVVCISCNRLHQKQGMKGCPSCRAPIQRRICARFSAMQGAYISGRIKELKFDSCNGELFIVFKTVVS